MAGRPKSENPKNKMISFRAPTEIDGAIKKFAEDIDASSTSEAILKAIEYGILYYYYTNQSSDNLDQ